MDYAPDPTYIQQAQANKNVRDNAYGAIAAQRINVGEEYGMDVDTGAVNANVDVTNPYSRAALMNRTYAQQRAGNMNNYAARGQLISGAYAARMAEDAQNQNQDLAGLQRDLASRRADWLSQGNSADANRAQSDISAEEALMGRRMAVDAPTFSQADKPANPTPPPPDYSKFIAALAAKLTKPTPKKTKKPKGKK
jgi:hypothetical protein